MPQLWEVQENVFNQVKFLTKEGSIPCTPPFGYQLFLKADAGKSLEIRVNCHVIRDNSAYVVVASEIWRWLLCNKGLISACDFLDN